MTSRIGSRWRWYVPACLSVVALWLATDLVRSRRLSAAPAVAVRTNITPSANRAALEADLDSLIAALDTNHLRYDDARRFYKSSEALTTFYSPTAASIVDGPEEPEESDAPPHPLGTPPAFTIISDWLGAGAGHALRDSVMRTSQRARAAVRAFRAGTRYLDVSDSATLDAARLELARIATIGIAGNGTLGEAATALDGVSHSLARLELTKRTPRVAAAISPLADASVSLRADTSAEHFDRFTFVARRLMPAARAILDLRRAVDTTTPALRRLWRVTSASPYDDDAFDAWAFAPEYAHDRSGLVALGAHLFADPRLSGSGDRSCASCHQPSRAFSDGLTTATPMHGSSAQLRNTPTLINAALQPAMFADMRAGVVEEQIRIVLSSPGEMGSSLAIAASHVADDSTYAMLTRRANATSVDERLIATALAAYVRSLTALRAPFDRAIRGDSLAVHDDARRGFNLFMGKARCGTCHFAPLFGGTISPEFARSEPEVVGVPSTDPGRMAVTGATVHRGAFRVPSVRNSAVTAPYMHNGSLKTLSDVVDFYDRGGRASGSVTNLTLPLAPLHLSRREKRDIVAFLQSLTDTVVAKP